MIKQNITVLLFMGGTSDERAVSLRSGAAVLKGLSTAGYAVDTFDYQGTLPAKINADIVFIALHGLGGEDGFVQKQLDEAGVSYVGSGAVASALCFDKWAYKQLLLDNNLASPNGELVTLNTFNNSLLSQQAFVLKPIDGGSSVDTIICRRPGAYDMARVQASLDRHSKMLLEALVTGTEITVGVLNEAVLPVIEIIPPSDGEFDYDNKYNGRTQEICPAQSVPVEVQKAAQELALKIHKLCDCRDMSRTDMIITDSNRLVVLETNTIPGLTDQSLLPKAAAVAGYSFSALVDNLVQAALQTN